MKVVLDTNVLVAAFVTEGICAKLLSRARRRQFLLFASPFILQEFKDVLRKRLSATRNEARNAVEILSGAIHEMVQPAEPVTGLCRDPNDDNILACALAAEADYLVSGDSDLLELKRFGQTRIVSPRDLELLFGD
ncbi:MAG: putative toxin-antitoxin system toxin component, PIN family [candidate division NC10 bacterium]|nr:putative toxin-antitoxin system toxin component, PIN family [candidate division NC10 bacterium]